MDDIYRYVLCVLLMAIGHLVRDGWPPIGATNLGSRPVGGLFCILGCIAGFGVVPGIPLGLSVLIGFWLDQKHGEGQRARGWDDAQFLAVSGITSVALTGLVAFYYFGWISAVFMLFWLVKPLIWFFWWHSFRWPHSGWLQPTRMSAITFGAAYGGVLVFIDYLTHVYGRAII